MDLRTAAVALAALDEQVLLGHGAHPLTYGEATALFRQVVSDLAALADRLEQAERRIAELDADVG